MSFALSTCPPLFFSRRVVCPSPSISSSAQPELDPFFTHSASVAVPLFHFSHRESRLYTSETKFICELTGFSMDSRSSSAAACPKCQRALHSHAQWPIAPTKQGRERDGSWSNCTYFCNCMFPEQSLFDLISAQAQAQRCSALRLFFCFPCYLSATGFDGANPMR